MAFLFRFLFCIKKPPLKRGLILLKGSEVGGSCAAHSNALDNALELLSVNSAVPSCTTVSALDPPWINRSQTVVASEESNLTGRQVGIRDSTRAVKSCEKVL